MPSTPMDAQGITLYRGNGQASETFVEITGATDFNSDGGSVTMRDRTTLKSTAKEKFAGLLDSGSVTFTLLYDPKDAVHQGLRSDWKNRTKRNFKVVFTDTAATYWTFSGYVTKFPVAAGKDSDVTSSVTIEITGAITEV